MKIFIQRVLAPIFLLLHFFFAVNAKTKWNRLRYIRFPRAREGGCKKRKKKNAKMNHRLWLSAPNTLTPWKFIVYDLPEWKVHLVCERVCVEAIWDARHEWDSCVSSTRAINRKMHSTILLESNKNLNKLLLAVVGLAIVAYMRNAYSLPIPMSILAVRHTICTTWTMLNLAYFLRQR